MREKGKQEHLSEQRHGERAQRKRVQGTSGWSLVARLERDPRTDLGKSRPERVANAVMTSTLIRPVTPTSTGVQPRLGPPLVDRDLAIVYPLLVHPFSA
jgi:hypothetical protein